MKLSEKLLLEERRYKVLRCKIFLGFICKFSITNNPITNEGINIAESMDGSAEMATMVDERIYSGAGVHNGFQLGIS